MDPSSRTKSTTTITASGLLLLLCVSFSAELVHGGQLVPALYVLGDSQADVGNNNYLPLTLARADFPRNGIDYPGQQPTGRFSNGYNFVDFLAGSLGLASPPAYHSVYNTAGSYSVYLNGINFASGGAGVFDLTNKGQCFSFDHQIERDFIRLHSELVRQLGEPQAMAHLARSIFAVAIGGNDIIDRALLPADAELTVVELEATTIVSTRQFIHSLAQTLRRQLQRLYDLGMRRLFFVGAAPIGCVPLMRELSRLDVTATGGCHQGANDMSAQYNTAVASLLRDMSTEHRDFQYSFFDTSTALMEYINEPEANGFDEVKAACCGLGDNNAMYRCGRVSTVCPDRTNHVFWDIVHPTETTARKLTGVAFDGSRPLVSPINVRKLCG